MRGWCNYYGHFYKSWLHRSLRRINEYLVRWARRKLKRLRTAPDGHGDGCEAFNAEHHLYSPTGPSAPSPDGRVRRAG